VKNSIGCASIDLCGIAKIAYVTTNEWPYDISVAVLGGGAHHMGHMGDAHALSGLYEINFSDRQVFNTECAVK